MLLSRTFLGEKVAFKMIPVTKDCPYNECIFDPERTLLAIVSKEKKDTLHMLPRLTSLGDVEKLPKHRRDTGKEYAEQRITLDTYYEYFIQDEKEIIEFIKSFSVISDGLEDFIKIVSDAFNKEVTTI